MRIIVLGLGYVGTITAAGLASKGHDVVGIDVDESKVEGIRRGLSPVVEPGIGDLVAAGVASGRLQAATEIAAVLDGADVTLVCVGTPSTTRGGTDLTFLTRALADLREAMTTARPPASGHHSVVIRSTVPPGTGHSVVAPLFAPEQLPAGWSVGTAMCPEFLREGSGVADFYDPPFVVVGTEDARTRDELTDLFAFLDRQIHQVDVPTAEALKYACNAFHAVKITFANEVGRLFCEFGVDSRQVMQIFCEDEKLNLSAAYLRPGFAFGGSCLPKDLRALQDLARVAAVDIPMISATTASNELVIRHVVDRVLATGLRHVCLLGLSFKSDTDDVRESPSLELAERFVGKGLEVRIFDPIVNPDLLVGANLRHLQSRLTHVNRLLAASPDDALSTAEIAIVTSTDPGTLTALLAHPPQVVLDMSGRLGDQVEHLPGYEGVSW
ncbi:nucleotide sugar dehydrogenase [Intrasporangium sp. YIM S08009]|uniref:nucleotide sugar dehydrogenase n=1 Tax=Intrasporangium zincisolvens TaxID=3080018 RepID=UPI002B058ECD|nr:nucleotide sugar dehydrogenase [Intrasporangium sp. YIM S08009]